jgi:heme/copper-type cytochrome/quinol oxidase subunit 3
MPPSVAYPSDALGSPDARRRLLTLVLLAAAVALGVVAYRVQVHNFSPHAWAAATVTVGLAFVLAGAAAWLRRPANR